MMNLGYALLVEGPLTAGAMQRAVGEVLAADPLLAGPWLWRDGAAAREDFAFLAARHLATPLEPDAPCSAALWSGSATSHLFLLSVHHLVADGVVLDRLATDLTRRLQGKELPPVEFAPQRALAAPAPFTAPRLPLAPAPPSVRASCRATSLPAELAEQFRGTMRGWRTTPFAGAIACVVSAVAGWTGQTEVGITIQVAGRNSNAALRAPGPWYDHANLTFPVTPGEPLRALLLDVGKRVVTSLTAEGLWAAARHEEPCPELLVVYDRFPLSAVSIPGCRVTPVAVQRQPERADGPREYLVATEADIVVFFREQAGTIGMSLFTKTARVPEQTAALLFDSILDTLHVLSADEQQPLDRLDFPSDGATSPSPVAWPEPALCEAPLVDAVSPVFRVRDDTLRAFARDAERTLHEWGVPPWQQAS
jgi:hypothetical protein